MTIAQAVAQAREQKERNGRLTNASIETVRQSIIDTGNIRFTIGQYLPLPGEAETIDEQAREQCRALLNTLLGNGHLTGLEVRYTKDTPNKPDKRLGMPYRIVAKNYITGGSKDVIDPEVLAERSHRNGTLTVFCFDKGRQDFANPEKSARSIKLGAVSSVEVKEVWYPVEYVKPNGEKVALHWVDLPVRQTV